MKSDKLIGMIQPKTIKIKDPPELYRIGCLGKIVAQWVTENRFLIEVKG